MSVIHALAAERTSNGIFSSTSFDPVNCGAPTAEAGLPAVLPSGQ